MPWGSPLAAGSALGPLLRLPDRPAAPPQHAHGRSCRPPTAMPELARPPVRRCRSVAPPVSAPPLRPDPIPPGITWKGGVELKHGITQVWNTKYTRPANEKVQRVQAALGLRDLSDHGSKVFCHRPMDSGKILFPGPPPGGHPLRPASPCSHDDDHAGHNLLIDQSYLGLQGERGAGRAFVRSGVAGRRGQPLGGTPPRLPGVYWDSPVFAIVGSWPPEGLLSMYEDSKGRPCPPGF